MRLIFLILMPFFCILKSLYLSFFAVLSLITFSSNNWQNTTIDIIQWRYCVHPTLNRYEQEIPLNPCDKERGSTRVWATGSQDVHWRMILPRILCLDARCHHIFWVSLFNLCFLYYIFCFLGSFTMSAVITLSILVATYRNATQLGGRCRSDVCPDEIFRKSMEYLFQEIHGTLIVDNPPG